MPPGLYVHFPWCVRKCPYCDFNSHELDGDIPEQAYITRLIEDLAAEATRINAPGTAGKPARLNSIFLGGGTPSLFTPAAIARLLEATAGLFDIDGIEITLEANPGTLEAGRFRGYRQAGVNRLSIGAQSFNDDSLASLGRIHRSGEIFRAFDDARQAGFDNINLDLMYGLPGPLIAGSISPQAANERGATGQSIADALRDLQQALDLAPEHISWYQLTIETNTRFHRYPPSLPDEDRLLRVAGQGEEALARHGYNQYEISAFTKPGREAAHNLNYWQFGDYLGIGAGAHGKLSTPDGIRRTAKTRMPTAYGTGNIQSRATLVKEDDIATEFLMNALRLNAGFNRRLFETRTGLGWQHLASFIAEGVAKGLLLETGSKGDANIQTSARGRRLLDELLLLSP